MSPIPAELTLLGATRSHDDDKKFVHATMSKRMDDFVKGELIHLPERQRRSGLIYAPPRAEI